MIERRRLTKANAEEHYWSDAAEWLRRIEETHGRLIPCHQQRLVGMLATALGTINDGHGAVSLKEGEIIAEAHGLGVWREMPAHERRRLWQ